MTENEKIQQWRDLTRQLCEIMRPSDVKVWVLKPNPSFENRAPIKVWLDGEGHRIQEMIDGIDANVAN